MKNYITWKNSFFSTNYDIYSNGKPWGKITSKNFSQTTNATINGKNLIFKKTGSLSNNVSILDASNFQIIGYIQYNSFLTKATISIQGNISIWMQNNSLGTK